MNKALMFSILKHVGQSIFEGNANLVLMYTVRDPSQGRQSTKWVRLAYNEAIHNGH